MITIHHPWVFTFGVLGNVISFMVFLAPLPTFIRVYKKKSTEGFQSFPYIVAIFSATLWIYYALLKGHSILLITINVAGLIIESIYIIIYITYAPMQAKMVTLKLLLFINFGGFCLIVLLCHYLAKGNARVQVFGWICVVFSVSVFAAPLSIMRSVIRTKSVEYMPFNLSLFLTLTATIWFMYGFLQKDLYITLPNVVGFIFGVAQMVLYGIYKKYDDNTISRNQPKTLEQHHVQIISTTSTGMKQNNNSISADYVTNNEDIIRPQQTTDDEVDEAVNVNVDEDFISFDGRDELVHVHGPPPQTLPTCNNVDLDKIACGPSKSSVQCVECAV